MFCAAKIRRCSGPTDRVMLGLRDTSRILLVDWFRRDLGLVLERSDALSAGVVGYGHDHLGDVVLVIRLRQLVAHARMERVGIATGLAAGRHETGIDRNS